MGGEAADAESLVSQVPAALGAHPVLIPQEPFAAAYSAAMNVSSGSPSTGFAGAQCCSSRADQRVHNLPAFHWLVDAVAVF